MTRKSVVVGHPGIEKALSPDKRNGEKAKGSGGGGAGPAKLAG